MGKVFHVDHQIDKKNVEDSVTEWTKVVEYSDINSEKRLFGGKLMSWIDEVARTVAIRHSGNPVITAAVDNMQFKQGAKLDDVLVIIGNNSLFLSLSANSVTSSKTFKSCANASLNT